MNCSSFLRIAVINFLVLTAFVSAPAQKAAISPEKSCGAYVQKFYDWYVPAAFDGKKVPASARALSRSEFAFSAELTKELKQDLAASAANPDDVVGLDFDPFLNTQDPAHHYAVGKVNVTSSRCRVELHSVEGGKKSCEPDVAPELELRAGRWVFVNFLYPPNKSPEDADLLAVLKTLREARRTHH